MDYVRFSPEVEVEQQDEQQYIDEIVARMLVQCHP